MTTLAISLPDSLKTFIDRQLATKGYADVSEYVGSLLRDAQAKEEDTRLEGLLLEGLESEPQPLDAEFWQRLESRTEAAIGHMVRKAP